MKALIAALIMLQSHAVLAQNCFERCNEDLADSKLPFMESNQAILSKLIGCKAPDFAARDIQGEMITSSDLRGKVVVMNFWYGSCAPCVAEMPALNKLVAEFKNQDVVFLAFSRDDIRSTVKFLHNRKFDYQIFAGADFMTDKYCVLAGWPMNLVIDRQGIVKEIFAGGYVDQRATTHAYDKMQPVIAEALRN